MSEIGEIGMTEEWLRRPSPPVKEGEEYDVEIEAVGRMGDGLTHIEGFVVFVPRTSAGDKVKVKITRVKDRYAFAETV